MGDIYLMSGRGQLSPTHLQEKSDCKDLMRSLLILNRQAGISITQYQCTGPWGQTLRAFSARRPVNVHIAAAHIEHM